MSPLDRGELPELVAKIMNGEYKSEAEADRQIDLFEASVPMPGASDLIFYPDEYFSDGHEPTPLEVVNRAFGYTPFEAGPAT